MKRTSVCSLVSLLPSVILILFVAALSAKSSALLTENNENIEGVYELVTQEVNITKPHKESYSLTPPRWTGIWQFNSGYFSSVLMKDERSNFFDCEERDLGYESFAGTYTLEGDEITFKQNYSLHPFYKGRPVVMNYSLKKNTLILIQVLHPGIEDMSEGTIKIVLRRLPKRQS